MARALVKTKKKSTTKTPKKPLKKTVKKVSKGKETKKVLKKKSVKKAPQTFLKLKKLLHNPIISPSSYPWESKATLNPAAFESDGKVYLIYRAIGHDDSSVLGYAMSDNGYNISDRSTHFVYKRFGEFARSGEKIDYVSGGGWSGGCEDPRLSKIGDTVYMTYTAFDGWNSVRIALTSISLADFKNKRWNWTRPVLLSPPGEIHKNWVIFPEKVNGKFAILTSITPKIMIEYVDSLDTFDGKKFIKSNYHSAPEWGRDSDAWDSAWVRGVGPTPIKTDLGWLVLYHAMDRKDSGKYKLGAMILDAKDPTHILYRAHNPILEPDTYYENEGYSSGVVYACGAAVKDGTLFVYYGGADKFVCVASIPLFNLLQDLKENKAIKLKTNPLKQN